jgi:hypothetical protein
MALPAFLAVRVAVRSQRQPAFAFQPVRRHFTGSVEGSIVIPVRAESNEPARTKLKFFSRASKQPPLEFEDGEVSAAIEKLILTAPLKSSKKLS